MEDKRISKAAAFFSQNMNCAQSVAAGFGPGYGISEETAFKAMGGFGGGLRAGEVCGAVSGAVFIIGLKSGHVHKDDMEAKIDCHARTEAFTQAFRVRYGALACRDFLGCEPHTPEGRAYYNANPELRERCKALVVNSARLLAELGY